MIDWDAVWADEVRRSGAKVDEIHTSRSVYGIYHYREHLVQLHENDAEIAAVWKDGRMVWLHPRTRTGLKRVMRRE
jgi:hypothetical protein